MPSLPRSLALSLALFGATAGSAAHAAGIETARIKQRRNGDGGRLLVRTAGDAPGDIARVAYTVRDGDGTALAEGSLSTPQRARADWSGTVGASVTAEGSTPAVLTYTVGGGTAFSAVVDLAEVAAAGGWLDVAVDETWKLRLRIDETGVMDVRLKSGDSSWGGDSGASMRIAVEGGETVGLTPTAVHQTFAADFDGVIQQVDTILAAAEDDDDDDDDPPKFWTVICEEHGINPDGAHQGGTGGADAADGALDFVVDYTVLDGDGGTVQTLQDRLLPSCSAGGPTVLRSKLGETRRGRAKLTTWTVSDGRPAALEVELRDADTGESPVLATDDTPVHTVRIFSAPLTWQEGDEPGTFTPVDVVFEDAEGGLSSGGSFELGHGAQLAPLRFDNGATGSGGIVEDASGTRLFLVYDAEDADQIAGVQVELTQPGDGDHPLETELSLGLDVQLDKWVVKGVSGVPARFEAQTTLVTPEGVALDGFSTTGSGTGRIYRSGDAVETYRDLLPTD